MRLPKVNGLAILAFILASCGARTADLPGSGGVPDGTTAKATVQTAGPINPMKPTEPSRFAPPTLTRASGGALPPSHEDDQFEIEVGVDEVRDLATFAFVGEVESIGQAHINTADGTVAGIKGEAVAADLMVMTPVTMRVSEVLGSDRSLKLDIAVGAAVVVEMECGMIEFEINLEQAYETRLWAKGGEKELLNERGRLMLETGIPCDGFSIESGQRFVVFATNDPIVAIDGGPMLSPVRSSYGRASWFRIEDKAVVASADIRNPVSLDEIEALGRSLNR